MFTINGYDWKIVFVRPNDKRLSRSDGSMTCGVTDWNTRCVYMSDMLQDPFLRKVMAHELCHCFCFSYSISMPIDEEEYLANWISLYGTELVYLLDDIMSNVIRRIA